MTSGQKSLLAGISVVSFLALSCCRTSPSPYASAGGTVPNHPAVTRPDYEAAVAKIRSVWLERCRGVDLRTREGWQTRSDELESLVRRSGPGVYHDFAEHFRHLPPEVQRPYDPYQFDEIALDRLVSLLAYEGPRAALCELLAAECPEGANFEPTEYLVVYLGRERIADGLLALCDAYDQTVDPANRRRIATLLRRAFPTEPWQGDGDCRLVSHIRAWYAANKSRTVPNEAYDTNTYRIAIGEKPVPLFVERADAGKE